MSKLLFLAPILALALIGAGCGGVPTTQTNSSTSTTSTTQISTPTTTGYNSPSPTSTTSTTNIKDQSMMAVDIRNFSFVPQSIAVQKGARIKFTNNDSVNHTVTGSAFDSGVIQPGESYVLDTSNLASGTYDYICTIHPNMKGAITIQ